VAAASRAAQSSNRDRATATRGTNARFTTPRRRARARPTASAGSL